GLLGLDALGEGRDEVNGPRLSRLETAGRKSGRRKLGEHKWSTGQGCCHILKFLRAGVHDVDADADSLASFKNQIAVVVQYGGFKRKGRRSGGGGTIRCCNRNHNRRERCRCRRGRCTRWGRGCRSGGSEAIPGRFGDFVRKLTRRTLNEVVQYIVA